MVYNVAASISLLNRGKKRRTPEKEGNAYGVSIFYRSSLFKKGEAAMHSRLIVWVPCR